MVPQFFYRILLLPASISVLTACVAVPAGMKSPPTPAEIEAAGDCGRAYADCVEECRAVRQVFDFERNREIDTFRTTFFDRCEESCRSGLAACRSASADAPDAFLKACRKTCPLSIWDSRIGNFLHSTEASTRCGEACREGAEALRQFRNPSESQGK